MEKYWVMTDYDLDGWKPTTKTDDWDKAVQGWKDSMENGNKNVVIVEPIPLKITDGRIERK